MVWSWEQEHAWMMKEATAGEELRSHRKKRMSAWRELQKQLSVSKEKLIARAATGGHQLMSRARRLTHSGPSTCSCASGSKLSQTATTALPAVRRACENKKHHAVQSSPASSATVPAAATSPSQL